MHKLYHINSCKSEIAEGGSHKFQQGRVDDMKHLQ